MSGSAPNPPAQTPAPPVVQPPPPVVRPAPASGLFNRTDTNYAFMSSAETFSVSGTTELRKRELGPPSPGIDRSIIVSRYSFSENFLIALYASIVSGWRGESKEEWVEMVASGVGSVLGLASNMVGQGEGIEIVFPDPPAEGEPTNGVATTAYAPISAITWDHILAYSHIDTAELSGYFGTLMFASCKWPTANNLSAFNSKRIKAIRAYMTQPVAIYVADSPALTLDLLTHNYACWNYALPARGRICTLVNRELSDRAKRWGNVAAFATQWDLLEDFGLSGLIMVIETLRTYPFIIRAFPELRPQVEAVDAGYQALQRVPLNRRSTCKVEAGNNFVTVRFQSFARLAGICREALSKTVKSLENFGRDSETFGSTSAADSTKLARVFAANGIIFEERRTAGAAI